MGATIGAARAAARRWATEEAATLPGVRGALLHGSAAWLPDDAALPATSDVDVLVLLAEPAAAGTFGKIRYRGVLLDVSSLAADQVDSPEAILGQYHLAGSFRGPSILLDPTGWLAEIGAVVTRGFAKRRWVLRRCEDARGRVLRHLQAADEATPLPAQVTSWLFAAGVTTHVLLVAGLRNPTVRRRYVAARELLADYGRLAFHETLLDLLGCAGMSQARAAEHLAALAPAFDAAKAVIRTPFFFASDISDLARPIAIDGSWELIERGDHREAVFWLVATFSRCQTVLAHDAPPELRDRFTPAYRDLLRDLGIAMPADLRERKAEVRAFLPRVWAVAEAIVAANPAIAE